MKIYKVGDSLKAACEKCKSFQMATFKLRDVPFSDGSGVVKNVLVGVCDCCDSVILLPHQSTPAVKKQLDVQRKSLESRVPAHMIDILNLAGESVGGGPDFSSSLLKFYIHGLAKGEIPTSHLERYLSTDLAAGASQKRISLKGKNIEEDIELLKNKTSLNKTSDILKSIVLRINDDLLVKKSSKQIKQLKSLAAIAS